MTPEEFSNNLPPLTADPLPIKPPFTFNSLSARVFPLRANLETLQQLCDGYLNIVPPEVGRFRAAVPYAYLAILDYGKISDAATAVGWFAQVEVFFSVPVQWYKLVQGRWVFHDWAVITPFIYVNDDISVPVGRTVYGFPKARTHLKSTPSEWVTYPLAPVTVAQMETAVFPELYEGKGLQQKTFLEVEHKAPPGNMRIPADSRDTAMPWTIAANMAESMDGFGRDAMWFAQAERIFPSSPAMGFEMLRRLMPALSPSGPGLALNSLNLKQFRRSDDPSSICYQALTNGAMQMTAFNAGGMLGEERIMLGDLSGGYNIRLHEFSSLPIARTLGLNVDRRWHGEGTAVEELKPVMPFWMEVNVLYKRGATLAWRAQDGIWKNGRGTPVSRRQKPAPESDPPRYNATVSSVIDALAGPFVFPDTTVRVLPLLAHKEQLTTFLYDYVNEALKDPTYRTDEDGEQHPEKVRLSVWSRPPAKVNTGAPIGGDLAYVYLTISSFGGVTSQSNDVGDWAKYDVAFMVPVKWERQNEDETWTVTGVGLLPAYNFVDHSIAAVARLEVQGIPTAVANFDRSKSNWLSDDSSFADAADGYAQQLLTISSEIIPALGANQPTMTEKIIEITSHGSKTSNEVSQSPRVAAELAERLRLELGTKKGTKARFPDECKVARAMALELLGNKVPFEIYTLKQFHDVVDPVKACFQSLQRLPRKFQEVTDIREIEATVEVRLHDYPTLKIAKKLGIVGIDTPNDGPGIVYTTHAVRPFYISGTMEEGLGQPLLTRAGTRNWSLSQHAFDSMLNEQQEAPLITVDPMSETLQDLADPTLMSSVMYQALQVRNQNAKAAISEQQVRDAFEVVDPQMVIESLLSREWGSADENARWRKGRQELVRSFDNLLSGNFSEDLPEAEALLYSAVYQRMAGRPGSPSELRAVVDDILERLTEFTEIRVKMEGAFELLAIWSLMRLQGRADIQLTHRGTAVEVEDLCGALGDLLDSMNAIAELNIIGEPSPRNGLYPTVLGDYIRLHELLDGPLKELQSSIEKRELSDPDIVEHAWLQLDAIQEAVVLARTYCRVQKDALLHKLSRAYQKPDFCIWRGVAGAHREKLLPTTLSWDEDWYYGKKINLSGSTEVDDR